MKKAGDQLARLCSMSIIDPITGCWNWQGVKHLGYGRLVVGSRGVDRRTTSAHRYSYELHIGPIPAGAHVCHRCDNRVCINPSHLFVGTRMDNMNDRREKGRNLLFSGENCGSAKLTLDQVEAIRSDSRGYKRMAALYGVDHTTIRDIRKGRTWANLPTPPAQEQP